MWQTMRPVLIVSILIVLEFMAASAMADQYMGRVLYWLPENSQIDGFYTSYLEADGGYPFGRVAAGGQVAGGWNEGGAYSRATILATDGTTVFLAPSGEFNSFVYATNGVQQAGTLPGGNGHAALWSGTAESAVDLNPSWASASDALGLGGAQQVGYAFVDGQIHSVLWFGTAASAVDLNPMGFQYSQARSTDGARQVGVADSHAMLWSGSAASAVDLNPNGFSWSIAQGEMGTQQVGWGGPPPGGYHALLWTGSAASAIDLNPSGWDRSFALETNGALQVGYTERNSQYHAVMWSGTAESALDLNDVPFLSGGNPTTSQANSVDAAGNVYGIAWMSGQYGDGLYAVEWSPVPEPGTLAVLGLGVLMGIRRRRPAPCSRPTFHVSGFTCGGVLANARSNPEA